MSHPKDYARVKPAPRNDSPSLSDSLLTPGQEKRYQFTTPPRRENRFRVIAAFVLFLSLGFNAVWFLGLVSGAHETCHATQETRLVMKDNFATVYEKDNKAWTDLQGRSWGTVYTKENREDGVVRMGGVAMFHQLHCLDSFRHAIQQLQSHHPIGFDHTTDTATNKGHWPHCFDYLRQILLCQADDTVETSQLAYTGDWIISGYGARRQCRDAGKLYEATDCGERGCPGTRWYLGEGEYVEAKKREWREAGEVKRKSGGMVGVEPDWEGVLERGSVGVEGGGHMH